MTDVPTAATAAPRTAPREIRKNSQRLVVLARGQTLYGHGNAVTGEDGVVRGNHNTVSGRNMRVYGDYNVLKATDSVVAEGRRNRIVGARSRTTATGPHNTRSEERSCRERVSSPV